MNLQILKPSFSFREFLSELITIVAGVVIALALEAAIEAHRNQELVEFSQADFKEEIASNRDTLEHELAESVKLQAALEQMIVYEKARLAHQKPAAPDEKLEREFAHLRSAAWAGALSTQVMAHFPDPEEQAIAKAYTEQQAFMAVEQSAELSWFNLTGYSTLPDDASDAEINVALQQFVVSYAYLKNLQNIEGGLVGTFNRALSAIP